MSRPQLILLLVFGAFALSCRRTSTPPAAPLPFTAAATGVFVKAPDVDLDHVFVLDARGYRATAPYLPRAHVLEWMSLRDGWGRTGRLAPEAQVRTALEELGVRHDVTVLVYGGWTEGWGEEGRLWWTLKYLGHPSVQILEGGVGAWSRARLTVTEPAPDARHGIFRTPLNSRLRATKADLHRAISTSSTVVIDARRTDEFEGATPYLSARGGHVPTARSWPWLRFIDEAGLKSQDRLRTQLKELNITPDTEVTAYCTGGVRSAFTVAVLHHLGVNAAKNYDGSWWEWSADDQLPVETSR